MACVIKEILVASKIIEIVGERSDHRAGAYSNILIYRTYQAGGIQLQPQPLPAVAEPVAGPAAVPDVSVSAYAHAYARECEHDTRAKCQPSATGPSGQQLEPVARPAGRGDEPLRDGQPLHPLAPRRLQSVSLNPTAPRSNILSQSYF